MPRRGTAMSAGESAAVATWKKAVEKDDGSFYESASLQKRCSGVNAQLEDQQGHHRRQRHA